ncbi:hypothetical protein SEMRO_2240_G320290.1 [Seminavis robusta]|nr:hypothetical protein SEMRO_2240_G320290.1 [Seminavis robusta]|eukprot:Sro2240_g320290.1 n/a (112) ;mRNA; r:14119-14454
MNYELQYPPEHLVYAFETQNEVQSLVNAVHFASGPFLLEQTVMMHEAVNGVQPNTNSTRTIIPDVVGVGGAQNGRKRTAALNADELVNMMQHMSERNNRFDRHLFKKRKYN